jgi:outer membrane protein assembly factor BamD (BamD/ComL family)
MRRSLTFLLVAIGLATVCRPAHSSSYDDTAAPKLEEKDKNEPTSKKRPGFFHRSEKASPAEQLVYAASLRDRGRLGAAIKQYDALVHTWHDAPEAVKAQLEISRLLVELGKYDRAFDECQYLVEHYAGDFPYEPVIERQFQIANQVRTARHANFLFLPGYATPERALPMYEKIVRNAPKWSRAADAQFAVGMIHQEGKEWEEAIAAYETVCLLYPDSACVAGASYGRAECLYLTANASPRDERSCREALSALAGFIRDYPKDANAGEAGKRLGELKDRLAGMYYDRAVYYDRIARKPASAVIAYKDFLRNFPTSEKAPDVHERIEALEKQVAKDEALKKEAAKDEKQK